MSTNVQQVHSRAVGEIDRCVLAEQHTGEKVTDQLDAFGLLVDDRRVRGDLHDLTAGESFVRFRACHLEEMLSALERLLKPVTFVRGRRIHPDRTIDARERRAQQIDQAFILSS